MNTEEQVQAFLVEKDIWYIQTYLELREHREGQQQDYFKVGFKHKNTTIHFDFYQGIGHRSLTKPKDKPSFLAPNVNLLSPRHFEHYTKKLNGDEWHRAEKIQYIAKPTSASVLYCLLGDARCGENTFDGFCDDLGYDNDSIEVLNTYQACQKIHTKLKKIFSPTDRDTLSTLLEDY